MGSYTSRLLGEEVETPEHRSILRLRRRRSSVNPAVLPPARRRRVLRIWNRDDDDDTPIEGTSGSGNITRPLNDSSFIDELDTIASDLFNTVEQSPRVRSWTDDDLNTSISHNTVSYENQIEMLSRLLEVAATSTVSTLMGNTFIDGRRFDNNNNQIDSTFQEFLISLRNGLLSNELSDNNERTFFRAFRFDEDSDTNVPVMIVGVRSINQDTDDDSASIDSANQRSWIIFVMGNTFNQNHPLLSAPSLMSDNPTYEDLLNLQELIGQVKKQVVSKDELHKHDDQLFEVNLNNEFIPNSKFEPFGLEVLERCQICLNDYENNEIIRKLPSCNHFYHKDCLDTWLLKGMNNCPLCRSKGICDEV